MSQEFEKIVLEKLDNFEGRFDKIEKTLDEHTEEFKKVNKALDEHTEQFKEVRKDIYEINNKIIKNTDEISDLTEVVRYNTETIKKINKDYDKKIDISLNAYEQLNGRVKTNEFMISNLKSKNFENDVRITALEDKIEKISMTA